MLAVRRYLPAQLISFSTAIDIFAVQLSVSLARNYEPGRRAVGHSDDGKDIPRKAFGHFECAGLWYWCEERYGYAARYSPLDIRKVS